MVRKFVVGWFVFAAVSGCRVCDHPYDYCGPVVDANFHPLGLRAGSVMQQGGLPMESIPAPPPTPTPPQPSPADTDAAPADNLEVPSTSAGFNLPKGDSPPTMTDMETISVMRSRLRYAR